jgi:Zn-dependent protease with chaperone function
MVGRARAADALRKLHLDALADRVTASASDEHWVNRSLWDELQRQVTALPPAQLQRGRWIDRELAARFGSTHPPTSLRLELIDALGPPDGALTVSAPESEAFERALREHDARVGRELIDQHHDRLYR